MESADAGTYAKVQLPQLILAGADAGNYTIAQAEYNTTNVTISKAPSYTVADIKESYIYTVGSEGKVEIDIAGLLKSDSGSITYAVAGADAEFVDTQSITHSHNRCAGQFSATPQYQTVFCRGLRVVCGFVRYSA